MESSALWRAEERFAFDPLERALEDCEEVRGRNVGSGETRVDFAATRIARTKWTYEQDGGAHIVCDPRSYRVP